MNRRAALAGGLALLATAATIDPLALAEERLLDIISWWTLLTAVAAIPVVVVADVPGAVRTLARSTPGRLWLLLHLWLGLSAVLSDRPLVSVTAWIGLAAATVGAVDLGGDADRGRLLAVVGLVPLFLHAAVAVAADLVVGVDLVRDGRLALLAVEPNHVARQAALAGLAALYLAGSARTVLARVAAVGAGAVAGGALLATDSRTGLAAAGMAAILLVARTHHRLLGVAGLGLVAAAGGLAAGTGLLGELSDGLRRSSDDPVGDLAAGNGRTELWAPLLDRVAAEPLVGYGPGLVREVVLGLATDGDVAWQAHHAHNLGLHLLLVGGVVAFVAATAAVALAALERGAGRVGAYVTAAALVVFVDGFVEAAVATPEYAWMVLGAFVAVPARPARRGDDETAVSDPVASSA